MMYTVVLLYPEHMSSDGPEIYRAHVEAATVPKAIKAARKKALADNGLSAKKNSEGYCNPGDFVCLLVFTGWHDDLNPE